MALVRKRIHIDWFTEIIGDEKGKDFFYARVRPVISERSAHSGLSQKEINEIVEEVRQGLQQRLNQKGKK